MDEWLNKTGYSPTMEYNSAMKKNFETYKIWSALGEIHWVKKVYLQKITYYMIPFMQNFQNNSITEMEKRLVIDTQ